jgi:hypothetical protein
MMQEQFYLLALNFIFFSLQFLIVTNIKLKIQLLFSFNSKMTGLFITDWKRVILKVTMTYVCFFNKIIWIKNTAIEIITFDEYLGIHILYLPKFLENLKF